VSECALIVGGSPEVDPRTVALAASTCSFVVAADRGAEAVRSAGLTADVVVGDFDSIGSATLEAAWLEGAAVDRHPEDKDRTDLELAVAIAREKGARRIVLTGVSGGRVDHALAAFGTMIDAADLEPSLVEAGLRAWLLDKRGRTSVALEPQGASVSILSLTPRGRAASTGLKWPLDGVRLARLSGRGVSNAIAAAPATITLKSGTLLVLSVTPDGTPPATLAG
jgi:thiamine pyrophosphokinase